MQPIQLTVVPSVVLCAVLAAPFASAQEKVERTVLYSSSLWVEGKYEVEGGYRIERVQTSADAEPTRELILDERFDTKAGPDLKVVLSPLAASQVSGKTALAKSLILGGLESNDGASRYAIAADVDLAQYRSLLIHCQEYTVLWGASELRSGEVVARGSSWTKKANKIKGDWEVAKLSDGYAIRFGETFDTKSGPDLKLVLSPHALRRANGDNALEGARIVAALKDDEGAQTYKLSGDLDLSKFRSLLIHCEKYSKLWGGVALR